jgi:hypothetical protein
VEGAPRRLARGEEPAVTGKQHAYTVHAVWLSAGTRGTDQGAIELIELDPHSANSYARKRSGDVGVKVAIVQRLEIGKLGTRHLVGWWVDGVQYGMGDVLLRDPNAELPEFLPDLPLLTALPGGKA